VLNEKKGKKNYPIPGFSQNKYIAFISFFSSDKIIIIRAGRGVMKKPPALTKLNCQRGGEKNLRQTLVNFRNCLPIKKRGLKNPSPSRSIF